MLDYDTHREYFIQKCREYRRRLRKQKEVNKDLINYFELVQKINQFEEKYDLPKTKPKNLINLTNKVIEI